MTDINIGSESDGYRLTVGGYSGMQLDNDIGVRVTDIVLHLGILGGWR